MKSKRENHHPGRYYLVLDRHRPKAATVDSNQESPIEDEIICRRGDWFRLLFFRFGRGKMKGVFSMLKKLNHALFESKTKDLSKDAIINYIKEDNKLRFKINEKGDMLLLDTKAASERFIKLLDDDYLYSKMTNTEYDSVQKDVFIQQED